MSDPDIDQAIADLRVITDAALREILQGSHRILDALEQEMNRLNAALEIRLGDRLDTIEPAGSA